MQHTDNSNADKDCVLNCSMGRKQKLQHFITQLEIDDNDDDDDDVDDDDDDDDDDDNDDDDDDDDDDDILPSLPSSLLTLSLSLSPSSL